METTPLHQKSSRSSIPRHVKKEDTPGGPHFSFSYVFSLTALFLGECPGTELKQISLFLVIVAGSTGGEGSRGQTWMFLFAVRRDGEIGSLIR